MSSLSALAEAVRIIERGQADAMIVGGVGRRLHPVMWVAAHFAEALARADDPPRRSRPFDAQRDGMVNGEGAAAFLLETAATPKPAAPAVARILGYAPRLRAGRTSSRPRRRPRRAIRRAIAAALHDAGLTPADLGCVVPTASARRRRPHRGPGDPRHAGRRAGDGAEELFRYLGAAAGALEAAVSVLSFQHGLVPPTLNYEHPDPQCPVNVSTAGRPRWIAPPRWCLAIPARPGRGGRAGAR